jgi:GH24 family phage-related lysozyme (muramidase)
MNMPQKANAVVSSMKQFNITLTKFTKEKLRQQLQEGSIRRAERDTLAESLRERNLALYWFVIEEEVWQHES